MCMAVSHSSEPREEKRLKPEKAAGRSLAAQFREIVTGAILEGEGRRKVQHIRTHINTHVSHTPTRTYTHTHIFDATTYTFLQKKAKAKDADAAPEKRKPRVRVHRVC